MKTFLFTLLLFVLLPIPAMAQWDDCPRGEVDCTGQCSGFVDTNNDGYCDHSQSEPTAIAAVENTNAVGGMVTTETTNDLSELLTGEEIKELTVAEVADVYQIDLTTYVQTLQQEIGSKNISGDTAMQLLHDNYGLTPSRAKEIAESLAQGEEASIPETRERKTENYNFIALVLGTMTLYILSWVSFKKKIISSLTHRKIWNWGLLVSFMALAVLSILLVLRVSFGVQVALPFNITFWHVESGIIFTTISVFHIIWHLSYFKVALQKRSGIK